MAKDLHEGDDVTWHAHGQTVHGEVTKKITSDTEDAGRAVRASKDDPQYEVRSDKNGSTAVHRPESLRKS